MFPSFKNSLSSVWSNFAVTKGENVSPSGDTEDQRLYFLHLFVLWSTVKQIVPPFRGVEPQPIVQLTLKLFERERWLLLGSGWMTLLGGMQKCFCSIAHTLQGRELWRGRTAGTIRRLMRIPMACSFFNHIYWASESTEKKNSCNTYFECV